MSFAAPLAAPVSVAAAAAAPLAHRRRRLAASLAAGALALALPLAQAAIAPDPGDYAPAPAGTNALLVYGQHITADTVKLNGQTAVDGLGLKLDVGVVRYVRYETLAGMPFDWEVIQQIGRQRDGLGSPRLGTLGDTVVGVALWPHTNEAKGEHLGLGAYLTLPTGSHKGEGFALSDNRHALDLQAAWMTRLAPQWSLDLLGQTELYARERDTDAKRTPLVRAFAHLRYHLSDPTYVALSYRHAWGAKETDAAGQLLNGRQNNGNLMLTWASFLTDTVQLQLQAAQDVRVHSGPKTRMLGVRTLFIF